MRTKPNIDGSKPDTISKVIKKINLRLDAGASKNLATALVDSCFSRFSDSEDYKDNRSVREIDLILGRFRSLFTNALEGYSTKKITTTKEILLQCFLEDGLLSKPVQAFIEDLVSNLITINVDIEKNNLIKLFSDVTPKLEEDTTPPQEEAVDQTPEPKDKTNSKPLKPSSKHKGIVDSKDVPPDTSKQETPPEDTPTQETPVEDQPGPKSEVQTPKTSPDSMFQVSSAFSKELRAIIVLNVSTTTKNINKIISTVKKSKFYKSGLDSKAARKVFLILQKTVKQINTFLKFIKEQTAKLEELLEDQFNAIEKNLTRMLKPISSRIIRTLTTQLMILYYGPPAFIGQIILAISAIIFVLSALLQKFGDTIFRIVATGILLAIAYVMVFLAKILPTAITILTGVTKLLGFLLDGVLVIIKTAIDIAFTVLKKAWPFVKSALVFVIDVVISLFDTIKEPLTTVMNLIVNTFIDVMDNVIMPVLEWALQLLLDGLKLIRPFIVMVVKLILPMLLTLLKVLRPTIIIIAEFLAYSMMSLLETVDVAYTWIKDKILSPIMNCLLGIDTVDKSVVDDFIASLPAWLVKGIGAICGAVGSSFKAIGSGVSSAWKFLTSTGDEKELTLEDYENERKRLVKQWNNLAPLNAIMETIKGLKTISKNTFGELLDTLIDVYNFLEKTLSDFKAQVKIIGGFIQLPKDIDAMSVSESSSTLNIIQTKLLDIYGIEADIEKSTEDVTVAPKIIEDKKLTAKPNFMVDGKINLEALKKYCDPIAKRVTEKIEARVVYCPVAY